MVASDFPSPSAEKLTAKRLLQLAFYFAVLLYFSSSVFYTIVFYGVIPHYDSINYYHGYMAIQGATDYLSASRHFFGHFPEVLLPTIYFVASIFFVPRNPAQIVVFDGIVFTLVYLVAIIVFVESLKRVGVLTREYALLLKIILLAIVPPGLALQLSRQAITFASIILISGLLIRKGKNLKGKAVITCILTPLGHVGSILAGGMPLLAVSVSRKRRSLVILVLLLTGSIIYVSFFLKGYLFGYEHPTLEGRGPGAPFSRLTCNVMLVLAMAYYLGRSMRGIDGLCLLLLTFTFAALPSFLIYRLMFGLDFFILPLLLIIVTARQTKKITRWYLILNLTAAYCMLLVKFALPYIQFFGGGRL